MGNFHSVDFWSTELKRMLEEQRPENLHLDYKDKESLTPPGKGGGGIDKQKRAVDISKDVSSFLNSNGGVLVYGVPETQDTSATGGSPIPGGQAIGFTRGGLDKETVENLITSNVQPRPGPELVQVTEVPYEGQIVFVVEVAVGIGDVWQAADRKYYRRFQFKAEPMEHYEINMVRNRNSGPDLKLVFGVNDRWETRLREREFHAHRNEEVRIHIGVRNEANTVAESALIELGMCPYTNDNVMEIIEKGSFPDNLLPTSFVPVGTRRAKWSGEQGVPGPHGVEVAWSELFWNGSNPELAKRYAPIFKTEAPLQVATVSIKGVYHANRPPQIAFCVWRLQAPNMTPKKGIVEIRSEPLSNGRCLPAASIVVEEKDWEIT